jgi:hypothetical protein
VGLKRLYDKRRQVLNLIVNTNEPKRIPRTERMTAITDENAGERMNKRDQTEIVIDIELYVSSNMGASTASLRDPGCRSSPNVH